LARSGVTRRSLVGGAAAGAAAAAVPRTAAAAAATKKSRRRHVKADVAVVGGGLAGLTTARRLVQHGVRDVVVLEARDRVGGRTFTQHKHGTWFDVGGQWIKTKTTSYGPPQSRIVALAKELGVKTFPTYYPDDGKDVGYEGGVRQTYPWQPTLELPPSPSFVDAATAILKLDQIANEVGSTAPWKAAKAAEYDGQTFETWIRANTTTDYGRRLLDLGAEAVLACEPRDVSLLYLGFYIASAGTLENLISTPLGYQESRFVGGAQQVSNRAARALGARVIKRSPVTRIKRTRTGVTVESRRAVVRCKHAVVAIPPALQAGIRFDPALPPLRAQLLQRFPMGSVIKANVLYDHPFWRDDGLTGFTISDQGPCRLSWDNSPPSGKPGVLVTFFEGGAARHFTNRTPAERREAVLNCFVRYFGPKARKAVGYVEQDWLHERWSRGCYVGIMAPGVMLDYGHSLRPHVGRVHWAGTETATRGAGYMDGAVQSGERAAAEVLARL
jgi:monoamine oxidase